MKQNNDFYDSLSQINKQIDLLKSISQTLAAGLYDQQQDLVLAALNLTTLENTKFSHELSRSFTNALPASVSSSCALLNSWYNATDIEPTKVLPASAVDIARKITSFSALQADFSPSSLGLEAINAAVNSIRILPNYIEFPAELIPDDFDYDKKQISPVQPKSVIKLPTERAQFLIGSILIPLMLWFASYFQNQSPSTWQEQHHQEKMEDTAKLIQQNDEVIENQRKQYEASLKIIELLEAIYSDSNTSPADASPFQAADSLLQRDDSHSSDDHSNDPQAESYPGSAEPKPSKSSGSSATSETLSESE